MSGAAGGIETGVAAASGLVLEVDGLSVDFALKRQTLHAVDAATL